MKDWHKAVLALADAWEKSAGQYAEQAGQLVGAGLPAAGHRYAVSTYMGCAKELRAMAGELWDEQIKADAESGALDAGLAAIQKQRRCIEITYQVALGNISSGKGREILRSEGFPAEIWGMLMPVIGEQDVAQDLETLEQFMKEIEKPVNP